MVRQIEVQGTAMTSSSESREGALSRASLEVLRTIDTFERIVLGNQPVRDVLDQQAETLRGLMQQANAPCWLPDAASEGACPVD